MKNGIFKLTDDGYGIHTFEMKILHLTHEECSTLNDRLFANGAMRDMDSKNIIIARTEKNTGIRIKLYKREIPYLEVIVNPWALLNRNAPLRIMNSMTLDDEKLRARLNETLHYYLGDEYGLERFHLTRIDCSVTFMLSDPALTIKYIDLIKRSLKKGNGNIVRGRNANSDEERREQEIHSFQVAFHGEKFVAYDKLYEIKLRDPHYYNDSGLLRIELAYNNNKINEISKAAGIDDIIGQVRFFCDNAETLMRKFIRYRFAYGDYFSYEAARQIAETSGLRSKSIDKILEHLLNSYDYVDYNGYIRESKLSFKSEMKYRVIMDNLHCLRINPVLIPRWDKATAWLPGMYSLFGMIDEEVNENG